MPVLKFYAFLLPDDKRKKRGHYKCYDGSRELFVALEAVNSGKMNAGQASKYFGIPRRTMYLKVKQFKMQQDHG